MSVFSKIVVAVLVVISLLFVKDKFFNGIKMDFFHQASKIEEVQSVSKEKLADLENKVDKKSKTKDISHKSEKKHSEVAVYYLVADKNGGASMKKVMRIADNKNDKLSIAIKELLEGPTWSEKSKGTYSEIPKGTHLLGIEHQGGNVIINLNSDFQYGGGTDSIYSRMRQLIKTALANSNGKNVYLYLDGKQIEIIGGEGIMISQPLSENSLDE